MSRAARKLYIRVTGGITKAAGGMVSVHSDDLMMLCEDRAALKKHLKRRKAQAGEIDKLIMLAASLVAERPPPAGRPARLQQMKVNGHDMARAVANGGSIPGGQVPPWHPEVSS